MAKQIAQLRFLRMAPRKVRLVANTLKGLRVDEAEAQLLLQPRRAAKPILKLLRSAVQNAKHNQKLNPETLFVESIRVDEGPMLKRSLPRARGSASPIHKKMSHIFLMLGELAVNKPKRFSIVVPKKIKSDITKKMPKKEKLPEVEVRDKSGFKKPGAFKRFFSRKSV